VGCLAFSEALTASHPVHPVVVVEERHPASSSQTRTTPGQGRMNDEGRKRKREGKKRIFRRGSTFPGGVGWRLLISATSPRWPTEERCGRDTEKGWMVEGNGGGWVGVPSIGSFGMKSSKRWKVFWGWFPSVGSLPAQKNPELDIQYMYMHIHFLYIKTLSPFVCPCPTEGGCYSFCPAASRWALSFS